jgi:hypothetical protein
MDTLCFLWCLLLIAVLQRCRAFGTNDAFASLRRSRASPLYSGPGESLSCFDTTTLLTLEWENLATSLLPAGVVVSLVNAISKSDIGGLRAKLKADISVLQAGVSDLKADKIALKAGISVLEAGVSDLKADIGVLKADMGALKADIGVLKADMGALKADMGALKADMGALKADMKADMGALKADMKADMGALKADMKADVAALGAKIDFLVSSIGGRLDNQDDKLKNWTERQQLDFQNFKKSLGHKNKD